RTALDARTGGAAVMRLVGRRVLMTLPTLFGVLVVAFLLMNVAPGDPVAAMVGERADAATIARLRADLHLDDPLPTQFGRYLWAVMHGDLGRSYITQRPIAQDLAARFPKTVQLALAAMALAALCGITLGVLSAIRPGEAVDRIAMLVSYVGVSFPVYWVGLLLILVFAVALRWLPPSGSGGLEYLVLPALTRGMRSIAFLARMSRAAMPEVLASDIGGPGHRAAQGIAPATARAVDRRTPLQPRHLGDLRRRRPRPRAVSAQRGSLLGARQQHQAGRHGGGGGAASGGLSRDDQPVRERPGGGGGAGGRPDLVRTRRSHVVRALLRRGHAGSGRVRFDLHRHRRDRRLGAGQGDSTDHRKARGRRLLFRAHHDSLRVERLGPHLVVCGSR